MYSIKLYSIKLIYKLNLFIKNNIKFNGINNTLLNYI